MSRTTRCRRGPRNVYAPTKELLSNDRDDSVAFDSAKISERRDLLREKGLQVSEKKRSSLARSRTKRSQQSLVTLYGRRNDEEHVEKAGYAIVHGCDFMVKSA